MVLIIRYSAKIATSIYTYMPYKEPSADTNSIFWKMENSLFWRQIRTNSLQYRRLPAKTTLINGALKSKKVIATLPRKKEIRKQIEETPIETLQKRNNVEATIFQLAYHYSNAKSSYRSQIKHQMWANIRCLWVNFVRILKYIKQLCQGTSFFAKYAIKSFLTARLPYHLSNSENTKFSIGWEN